MSAHLVESHSLGRGFQAAASLPRGPRMALSSRRPLLGLLLPGIWILSAEAASLPPCEYCVMRSDLWTSDLRAPVLDLGGLALAAEIEASLEDPSDADYCELCIVGDQIADRRLTIEVSPSEGRDVQVLIFWNGVQVDELNDGAAGEAERWSGEVRPGSWIARVSRASSDRMRMISVPLGGCCLRVLIAPLDYTVHFEITGTARRAAGMPPVLVLRSPSPSPEIRYEPLPGTTTQVRVLAVDGREVASREWLGGREHRLFLSGLPNGIYFVRLAQGRDVIATKRAVVLR